VASDEGFPASHFVGVAGVGADAARLAKSHPRAGVFGVDRRTTRDDIKDGAANTLMVMGVETHPPAWADGVNTVRGLTAEPYFSGPDNFGTGQADGMHVLMADGSVRFLSKDTDPRLMRRMAAMADGLPLDANVPGEPADPVTKSSHPGVAAGNMPAANDPPITVEVTPESKGYDVDRGLAVAVTKFELKTPVPLRTLLRQIVEMSALPIDLSQVKDDPRLDQPITLDLKDTTLRVILSTALAQAQLEFTGDAQGIHLQPVQSQ
jgi:antitoxin component of RelBE/YafQ-DinJ toxin-antitoxin module